MFNFHVITTPGLVITFLIEGVFKGEGLIGLEEILENQSEAS